MHIETLTIDEINNSHAAKLKKCLYHKNKVNYFKKYRNHYVADLKKLRFTQNYTDFITLFKNSNFTKPLYLYFKYFQSISPKHFITSKNKFLTFDIICIHFSTFHIDKMIEGDINDYWKSLDLNKLQEISPENYTNILTDFIKSELTKHPSLLQFFDSTYINNELLLTYYPLLASTSLQKLPTITDLQDLILLHQEFSTSNDVMQLPKICPCQKCQNIFFDARRNAMHKTLQFLKDQFLSDIYKTNNIYTIYEKLDSFKKESLNLSRKEKIHLDTTFFNTIDKGSEFFIFFTLKYQDHLKKIHFNTSEQFLEEALAKFFINYDILHNSPSSIIPKFQEILTTIRLAKSKDTSTEFIAKYLENFWQHFPIRSTKRKITYHMGPTNSGKTYHALQRLSKCKNGIYLAPLRLLATEQYEYLNSLGVYTSLLTGEEVVDVDHATHLSATVEMFPIDKYFEAVVIDEIQMIADPQRGHAWTMALMAANTEELHLCGDGSVINLIKKIVDLCQDELTIINYQRMVELKVEDHFININELQRGDAVIVFSRNSALEFKKTIEKMGFKVSVIYGRLGPEVRREQARLFDTGETDVIVSTDAIAMGMNLPIRRIVFSTLSKIIDREEFQISQSEIKQLSGRAGRFNRFPIGFVNAFSKIELATIKKALQEKLIPRETSILGPDLKLFRSTNELLENQNFAKLKFTQFLRIFSLVKFSPPFFCMDLSDMVYLADHIESIKGHQKLSDQELFTFAAAPVSLNIDQHLKYYLQILHDYISRKDNIVPLLIDTRNYNIDSLEVDIKCVELYQWLALRFPERFTHNKERLLTNKKEAITMLNELLLLKKANRCIRCGAKLKDLTFRTCFNCRHHGNHSY